MAINIQTLDMQYDMEIGHKHIYKFIMKFSFCTVIKYSWEISRTQKEQNDSSLPNDGEAEKVSTLIWLVNQEDSISFSMLLNANMMTVVNISDNYRIMQMHELFAIPASLSI